ncbi:glutaredoxin domain-containing protein [Bacillus stercoris]|nr:glutaredoxin domain-containing protein [Bacillus stercoris]
MKLLKIEKPNCPACNQVGEFLNHSGVEYQKVDIYEGDLGQEILGKLGLFTVPVTVLLDGEDILSYVPGFNIDALTEIVEKAKK